MITSFSTIMTNTVDKTYKTIETNYRTFNKLLKIPEIDSEYSERIMMCPASTRYDLVCAYPGGLVEHSLRVLAMLNKYIAAYPAKTDIENKEIIQAALLHDIGKIGTDKFDYYMECESDWHRNKLGMMYEINPKLVHWTPSQLSLMLITSKTDLKPSEDVWYAISSIRESRREEYLPSSSNGTEPKLAVLLQQAIRIATMEGKNKKEPSVVDLSYFYG